MFSRHCALIVFFGLFFADCSTSKKEAIDDDPPPAKIIPFNEMIFESGLFAMHRAAVVTSWEQSRGAEVAVIAVAPSRESWEALQNTWFMDDERIPVGFKGTLNIAMPLWPEDGNLDDAYAGNYNAEWEKFGKSVAAKYPNAYIRIGWEMNLNDWYFKATPDNAEHWKKAFINAVISLRKASTSFRIIFNPNEGAGQTGTEDATLFYPGDEYVDLIGLDAYDWSFRSFIGHLPKTAVHRIPADIAGTPSQCLPRSPCSVQTFEHLDVSIRELAGTYDWWPGYTNDANIARHRDSEYGWNWWLDFTKRHNKKFCLPEWGIATANSASGGDNPLYINFVYPWLKENKSWVQMECYFDESADYLRSDLFTGYNPKASAEYKRWMPLLKKD